ncbi:YqgE/AlgH family protein [Flavihumibacter sp. R14]|nr:YqgE/AlgH family protein [Flavihumibacter soli]
MISQNNHQSGSLLVSEPFMLDPNFKRSVVLLTEHSDSGSIGFVLNQRSDLLLSDVIPDCWDGNFPIFVGGPVGNDTLHFIHRCYDKLLSGIEVKDGVYWGGDFETLKILINSNSIHPQEIRFFIGYSGWGEEQLDTELEQNSWLITNNYTTEALFTDGDNLWKEIVISLGPKYAHIANFPENPMWN